jgi:hypothetical protein
MVQRARSVLQSTLASLEAQKAQIDVQIKAIRHALAAIGVSSPNLAGRKLRRPMGAAERKSVSRRMKAYWAKKKRQKARH